MAQSKAQKDMRPFKRANGGRGRVEWRGLELDPVLLTPTFQRWAIGLFLALTLAFLFEYPRIGNIELGTYKENTIAKNNVYAPKELLVEDEEQTKKAREDASLNTLPVFDYDSILAKTIEEALKNAFGDARKFFQREWDWVDAERNRVTYLRSLKSAGRVKQLAFIPDDDYSDREEELRLKFSEILSDLTDKTLEISDKSWSNLKSDRFNKDTANKIVVLFQQVMSEGVVLNKNNFPADSEKGISVLNLAAADSLVTKKDVSTIHLLKNTKKIIRDRAKSQYSKKVHWKLRSTLANISYQLVIPNYTFNNDRTKKEKLLAKENTKKVLTPIYKGDLIVAKGETITKDKMVLLAQIQGSIATSHPFTSIGGNFMWLLVLLSVLYAFSVRNIRKFAPTNKDVLHMALLAIFLIAMLKLVLFGVDGLETENDLNITYLVPMMAGAMMVRLVINSEAAIIFSILISIVSGLLTGDPIYGLYVMVGSVVGSEEVGHARTRSTLAKAGLMTGAVNVVIVLAIALKGGDFAAKSTFYHSLFALGCGITASFLVLGITPLVENLFGYVTDIRLLELANLEHPLLKRLIMKAPGTYQHSVVVGIIAEDAAMAIHVNPLLVKVTALYHDIGKMEKSKHFVENLSDVENPHDKLNPSMSSLIISSHVKYGMELAKMYRLPQVIIDAIPQHHGTSLIKYFYAKAKEKEDPELSQVDEKNFRYPGPRPQTREMAILMLADSVEAAARSLPEPSPTKLKNLVRKIIIGIFNDGQLDECDLTLRDLSAIAEAFTNTLSHMYHSRPEYPELPGGAGGKKDSGRKNFVDQDTPRELNLESGLEGEGEDTEKDQKGPVRSGA